MSKANPKMPIAVQQTPNSAGAAGAGAASEWTVGALCMAKYAADGKFYPAQVVEVTPKGVKVSFTEYENEFQVCAAKDLKVFVVKTGPAKVPKTAPLSPKQGPKAAPVSPKQGPKAAPVSPKQGPKAASPSLGPMKSVSPRGSPKFSPVDPVKQAFHSALNSLCWSCFLFLHPEQEALALLQPALLKDAPPLKFSQFISDRGSRSLIDLGLMSVIQDSAKNKKLTVQREGAMDVLASLCSVVGRPGQPCTDNVVSNKNLLFYSRSNSCLRAFPYVGDSR